MRMAIIGISGRMGRRIYDFYKNSFDIVGVDSMNFSAVDTYKSLREIPDLIDVVVDFSSISAKKELEYAIDKGILTLSGTTGYDDKVMDELQKKGKDLFYWSSNYSKGIDVFSKMIDVIKEEYDLFDFIEIHSATKKDSPSGTAKMLARKLDLPYSKIQSLRIHYAPPIHELIFSSKNEQIVIRHEVTDSTAFLDGFDAKLQKMLGK